jgi:hypothetical protein
MRTFAGVENAWALEGLKRDTTKKKKKKKKKKKRERVNQ